MHTNSQVTLHNCANRVGIFYYNIIKINFFHNSDVISPFAFVVINLSKNLINTQELN